MSLLVTTALILLGLSSFISADFYDSGYDCPPCYDPGRRFLFS